MKDKFIQFLKDEGAYDKFIEHFKNQRPGDIDEYCTDHSDEPEEWVLMAFMWPDVEVQYWLSVSNKWRKLIGAEEL